MLHNTIMQGGPHGPLLLLNPSLIPSFQEQLSAGGAPSVGGSFGEATCWPPLIVQELVRFQQRLDFGEVISQSLLSPNLPCKAPRLALQSPAPRGAFLSGTISLFLN
jgi:hypothetical protein